MAKALKIIRIALNVADLAGTCGFYQNALGFTLVSMTSGSAVLDLGGEQIELTVPDGPRPYPQPRAGNDPWFQHFAVAVSDMEDAYSRLAAQPQQPISDGGPQLLPPGAGSVTAYKFRDPEGHPLELSYIPGSPWLDAGPRAAGPFLGIDHTALAVADLDASVAFYTQVLGFEVAGRSLNTGPEQDRLDGLARTQVEIVSLNTVQAGPHIELLHYRSPTPAAAAMDLTYNDIAATRLLILADDLDRVGAGLEWAGRPWMAFVDETKSGVMTSDPDGHRLELRRP